MIESSSFFSHGGDSRIKFGFKVSSVACIAQAMRAPELLRVAMCSHIWGLALLCASNDISALQFQLNINELVRILLADLPDLPEVHQLGLPMYFCSGQGPSGALQPVQHI